MAPDKSGPNTHVGYGYINEDLKCDVNDYESGFSKIYYKKVKMITNVDRKCAWGISLNCALKN